MFTYFDCFGNIVEINSKKPNRDFRPNEAYYIDDEGTKHMNLNIDETKEKKFKLQEIKNVRDIILNKINAFLPYPSMLSQQDVNALVELRNKIDKVTERVISNNFKMNGDIVIPKYISDNIDNLFIFEILELINKLNRILDNLK